MKHQRPASKGMGLTCHEPPCRSIGHSQDGSGPEVGRIPSHGPGMSIMAGLHSTGTTLRPSPLSAAVDAIAAGCGTVLLQGALIILVPEPGEGRIDAPLLALAAAFAGCGLGFGRVFAQIFAQIFARGGGGGLAGSLGGGAALGLATFGCGVLVAQALRPGLLGLADGATLSLGLLATSGLAVVTLGLLGTAGRRWRLLGDACFGAMAVAPAVALLWGAAPALGVPVLPTGALPVAAVLGAALLGPPLRAVLRALLRRRSARGLAAETGRLGRLADAVSDGIVFLEAGRITGSNRSFQRLLGRPTAVPPQTLRELFPHQGSAWHSMVLETRLEGTTEALLAAEGGGVSVELEVRRLDAADDARLLLVCRDLRDRIATATRMHHLTSHDPLTDLPNRAQLLRALGERVERARLAGRRFAVLLVGLDGFRSFNDLYGYAAGDRVLRDTAGRIRATVAAGDLVARIGGDAFIVLPAAEEQEAPAGLLADRLIAALAAPHAIGAEAVQVTGSIGVALFPRDADQVEDLLGIADVALRRAKDAGRGRVALVQAELDAAARSQRGLEQELKLAIAFNQFRLAFQPQARTADLAATGFEALLRWQHPPRGPVAPDAVHAASPRTPA